MAPLNHHVDVHDSPIGGGALFALGFLAGAATSAAAAVGWVRRRDRRGPNSMMADMVRSERRHHEGTALEDTGAVGVSSQL